MSDAPNPQVVMFDLDGTLLDTAPDFVVALNRLLAEHGRATLAPEVISRSVSNGARALIALGFGIDNEQDPHYQQLRARLLELYMQNIAEHTQLYPGLQQALNELDARGIGWGIATNKPALYTEALLAALALQPQPSIVICPDHVTRRKPDPESLIMAAQHFNCAPEHILYLGDHQRDIDCGRAAGATTIACGYGYISEGDDPAHWQADYVVNASTDVGALLDTLLAGNPS